MQIKTPNYKRETLTAFRYELTVRDEILRSLASNYSFTRILYFDFPDRKINNLWSHIRYQLFKSTLNDIAMLMRERKETDSFNFFTFLNRIETGDFKVFKINKSRIVFYRNELTKLKIRFNSILHIRDNYIAHIAGVSGLRPIKLFPNVEKLINFLFEMLNEFKQVVLNEPVINILPFLDLSDLKKTVELSMDPRLFKK